MKKFVIVFIMLVVVVGFTYQCSNIGESQTERLFSEDELEMMNPNLIRVAPSDLRSFNSYEDSGVDYDAYYMFDRNTVTGWIGELDKDLGRAVILFYDRDSRDFDITHIRVKSGIENGKADKNDYSKPKTLEFQFYKLVGNDSKPKVAPKKDNEKKSPKKTPENNPNTNAYGTSSNTNTPAGNDNNVNDNFSSSTGDYVISPEDPNVISHEVISASDLSRDEYTGPVAIDDYSGANEPESPVESEMDLVEVVSDDDKEETTEEGKNTDSVNSPEYEKKQRKVDLVYTYTVHLENTDSWQVQGMDKAISDFDFVNVYVKDAYEGYKHPGKVAISEIEMLTSGDLQIAKEYPYEDRYDSLKDTYEENDKTEFLKGKSTEVFYPEYKFEYRSSNLNEFYRKEASGKRIFKIVVPTFEKLVNTVGFGSIPEDQMSYLNELPTYFDSTKMTALKNVSSRQWKYRSTFFVYFENPKSAFSEMDDSPLFFPFMKYLGTSFRELKLKKRLKDPTPVLNKWVRTFFRNNKKLEYFFIVRTHNNRVNGKIKYAIYYNRDRIDYVTSKGITGFQNDPDPVCIFIYDKHERLVKVAQKEYGREEYYFIIWDENNKVEKVLVMETGDFGLKRIQKIIAKKPD